MSAKKQTRNRNPHKPRSDFQRLTRRFMSGLLRSLLLTKKTSRAGQSGFVLPTTVLLLLVVSLTVGAMSFRTFSRVEQTIAYRDQLVLDSIAAPAIDRAKAKIEYLFTQDASVADKRPPSSDDLITAMAPQADDKDDAYTITDDAGGDKGGETRIDITGDDIKDTAWSFRSDGTQIVYSIILDDTDDKETPNDLDDDITLENPSDSEKAKNLVVRNGPIDTTTAKDNCPISRLAGNGWQLSNARLAKNIQVDVLAIKGTGANKTVTASEYQQVRTASRGNRWGAWWRYDIGVAPGAPLRWNGAIHTEGSFITNKNFVAYAVSSKNSCVYDEDASVIEVSGPVGTDFLGQLVSGSIDRRGSGPFVDGTGVFHTAATAENGSPYSAGIENLYAKNNHNGSKDSVTPDSDAVVADIMQDPIKIFTEDGFVHNNADKWDRFTDWEKEGKVTRVKNDNSNAARPFLDDSYRADNRYGPKFAYNEGNTFSKVQGEELPTADKHKAGEKIDDNNVLTKNIPDTENYGLDGYWERRAADKGLRIVVGQRLELGNSFGWEKDQDPLYPANSAFSPMRKGLDELKGTAETLQMRSLRDNLAAVQSMAVYHSADATTKGQYPLACMASVSHPGNKDTLLNSRTFERYPAAVGTTIGTLKTDFLTGQGTNGIEFSPPASSNFSEGTGLINSKWVTALENLAYFAGDLYGGAPSFPAVQGQAGATDVVMHPYPYMAMWGDFSILRRIFTDAAYNYSPATKYDELSLADKSTIHTAACTLGMLAYNVEGAKSEAISILEANLLEITNAISASSGIESEDSIDKRLDMIEATAGSDFLDDNEENAIKLYRQILRDRNIGFIAEDASFSGSVCADSDFNVPGADSTKRAALALALCSKATGEKPNYPSLYYLFPLAVHDQTGTGTQTETYLSEEYLVGTNGINKTASYKVVDTDYIKLLPRDPNASASGWRTPKVTLSAASSTDDFDFVGPVSASAAVYNSSAEDNPGNVEKNLSQNVISVKNGTGSDYTYHQTSMLDKAMMDGRELLTVRLTDLDINLLTNTSHKVGGKVWIPEDSGIFYAFREDAIREDSIVRPFDKSFSDLASAWATCSNMESLTTNDKCHMSLDPTGASDSIHDPPLNIDTRISPKPVDLYADPARRPYGFRLINGKSLNRTATKTNDPSAGMTFVTDNATYIKGDFNIHAVKGSSNLENNLLEEFKGSGNLLGLDFAKKSTSEANARKIFYRRDDLDNRFADPSKDNWRPVEIFADSINILSNIFLDGWTEDYFTTGTQPSPGNNNRGKPKKNSSFLNANRPWFKWNSSTDTGRHATSQWQHESSTDIKSPIFVDRNGKTFRKLTTTDPLPPREFPRDSTGSNISFYKKNDNKFLYLLRQTQQPSPPENDPVRINALLIGGVVPARDQQSNGGLYNFPRMSEYWDDRELVISGGFFQLNFSSQATAPWDQDAWEPGAPSHSGGKNAQIGGTGNQITSVFYYGAPTRIWGYDVGFQYTPAAPIAQRFVRLDRPRSEFYRELPVDDEYIKNLCQAPGVDC